MDNFGFGYPSQLQGLLDSLASPSAQPQSTLDAYKAMNGGGYIGGVVNAPTTQVNQPSLPPAQTFAPSPQQGPAGAQPAQQPSPMGGGFNPWSTKSSSGWGGW